MSRKANWSKSPSVDVIACDRNGHVLEKVFIHRTCTGEVVSDRVKVFEKLRAKHPDCQVYYQWHDRTQLSMTEEVR